MGIVCCNCRLNGSLVLKTRSNKYHCVWLSLLFFFLDEESAAADEDDLLSAVGGHNKEVSRQKIKAVHPSLENYTSLNGTIPLNKAKTEIYNDHTSDLLACPAQAGDQHAHTHYLQLMGYRGPAFSCPSNEQVNE